VKNKKALSLGLKGRRYKLMQAKRQDGLDELANYIRASGASEQTIERVLDSLKRLAQGQGVDDSTKGLIPRIQALLKQAQESS
jgi:hypothetical protein